ncbi:MAG TPA: ElyC/SanA/YdcF family protein [Phycisphaerae bacterium]|nr:ElyC/SanA/YdcF family protein [Phycisphaerae bacterium]HOJ76022.1 ElyC/SanA/YdcF family protein [Phycisphaerae bacterium]HOM52783.1 ElyC/SanA/YdcF family protein [Phycisphaerae bacterium]HON65632.1 ElyC/SanA/YdcF family protein [Phycisphaerae bacterium]HPP28588.1 ElyC/SanA/YdcF family protein [Phycisphaerae bacterium]
MKEISGSESQTAGVGPAASDSPGLSAAPSKPRQLRRWAGWLFRTTRNLLALAMLLEIVMVLAPLPERVYYWLAVGQPPPKEADYIVCLGGGTGREVKAAQLWLQKVAPVVIVSNAPGAAEWMRNLIVECGVPRKQILVDNRSHTTHMHPAGVAKLPGVDPQNHRFVLVTEHTHARRARACFAAAGYKNLSVYTGRSPRPGKSYWDHCEWRIKNIPSIIYECAGLITYWAKGNISYRDLF